MDKWIPSQKQQLGLISRTFEVFNDDWLICKRNLIAQMNLYVISLKLLKIIGRQKVVTQNQDNTRKIIQALINNAKK